MIFTKWQPELKKELFVLYLLLQELVTFNKISPLYPAERDVTIQYTLGSCCKETPIDWIGIVRSGELDVINALVFQWTNVEQAGAGVPGRRSLTFPAKLIQPLAHQTHKYQFIYVSNRNQICGASQPFMIREDICRLRPETCAVSSADAQLCHLESVSQDPSGSSLAMSSEDEWELAAHSALHDQASCTSDLSDIVILSTSPSKETARAELRSVDDPHDDWNEENLKSVSESSDDSRQMSYSDVKDDVFKTEETHPGCEGTKELAKRTFSEGKNNVKTSHPETEQITDSGNKPDKHSRKSLAKESKEKKNKQIKKLQSSKKASRYELTKQIDNKDNLDCKSTSCSTLSDLPNEVTSKYKDDGCPQAMKTDLRVDKHETPVTGMKQQGYFTEQHMDIPRKTSTGDAENTVPEILGQDNSKHARSKKRKDNADCEAHATSPIRKQTNETECLNNAAHHGDEQKSTKPSIAFDELVTDMNTDKKRKETQKSKTRTKETRQRTEALTDSETNPDVTGVKQKNAKPSSKYKRELTKEARRIERKARRSSKPEALPQNVDEAEKTDGDDDCTRGNSCENRWNVLSIIPGEDVATVAKKCPHRMRLTKKERMQIKHKQQALKSLALDPDADIELTDTHQEQIVVNEAISRSKKKLVEIADIQEIAEQVGLTASEGQNKSSQPEVEMLAGKHFEGSVSKSDTNSDGTTEENAACGKGGEAEFPVWRTIGSCNSNLTSVLSSLSAAPKEARARPSRVPTKSRLGSLTLATMKSKYKPKNADDLRRMRILRRWLSMKERRISKMRKNYIRIQDGHISSMLQLTNLNEENASFSKFSNSYSSASTEASDQPASALLCSAGHSYRLTSPLKPSLEDSNPDDSVDSVTADAARYKTWKMLPGAETSVSLSGVVTRVPVPVVVTPVAPVTSPPSSSSAGSPPVVPPKTSPDVTSQAALPDFVVTSVSLHRLPAPVTQEPPTYASILKRSKQGGSPLKDADYLVKQDSFYVDASPGNGCRGTDMTQTSMEVPHKMAACLENVQTEMSDVYADEKYNPRVIHEHADIKIQKDSGGTGVMTPHTDIQELREARTEGHENVTTTSWEKHISEILYYQSQGTEKEVIPPDCKEKLNLLPECSQNVNTVPKDSGFKESKHSESRNMLSETFHDTANPDLPLTWPLPAVVRQSSWLGLDASRFEDKDEPLDANLCENLGPENIRSSQTQNSTRMSSEQSSPRSSKTMTRCKENKNNKREMVNNSRNQISGSDQAPRSSREGSNHKMESPEARLENMETSEEQGKQFDEKRCSSVETADGLDKGKFEVVRRKRVPVNKTARGHLKRLTRSNVEILSLKSQIKTSDSRVSDLEAQLSAIQQALRSQKETRKALKVRCNCLKVKVNIKNKAGKEKYREISCESPGVQVEQDSSEVSDHHNVSYDSQHHVEKRRTESEIPDISINDLLTSEPNKETVLGTSGLCSSVCKITSPSHSLHAQTKSATAENPWDYICGGEHRSSKTVPSFPCDTCLSVFDSDCLESSKPWNATKIWENSWKEPSVTTRSSRVDVPLSRCRDSLKTQTHWQTSKPTQSYSHRQGSKRPHLSPPYLLPLDASKSSASLTPSKYLHSSMWESSDHEQGYTQCFSESSSRPHHLLHSTSPQHSTPPHHHFLPPPFTASFHNATHGSHVSPEARCGETDCPSRSNTNFSLSDHPDEVFRLRYDSPPGPPVTDLKTANTLYPTHRLLNPFQTQSSFTPRRFRICDQSCGLEPSVTLPHDTVLTRAPRFGNCHYRSQPSCHSPEHTPPTGDSCSRSEDPWINNPCLLQNSLKGLQEDHDGLRTGMFSYVGPAAFYSKSGHGNMMFDAPCECFSSAGDPNMKSPHSFHAQPSRATEVLQGQPVTRFSECHSPRESLAANQSESLDPCRQSCFLGHPISGGDEMEHQVHPQQRDQPIRNVNHNVYHSYHETHPRDPPPHYCRKPHDAIPCIYNFDNSEPSLTTLNQFSQSQAEANSPYLLCDTCPSPYIPASQPSHSVLRCLNDGNSLNGCEHLFPNTPSNLISLANNCCLEGSHLCNCFNVNHSHSFPEPSVLTTDPSFSRYFRYDPLGDNFVNRRQIEANRTCRVSGQT